MKYNHKVIGESLPELILWEFTLDVPYIPNIGDKIIIPTDKIERWYKVVDVHHFFAQTAITIITKPI